MSVMTKYSHQLLQIAAKKRLWFTILGTVEEQPIWLVRTSMGYDKRKPHILVAAGFHGEEKAGPLAILKWLESKQWSGKLDVSFLPVVNPVAFNAGKRYNKTNQTSNCGFCHTKELGDTPSLEGQTLLANEHMLKRLARDGFLSLHEDIATTEFYVYSYEPGIEPSPFALAIRDVEDRFFQRYGDGNGVVTDGSSCLYPERGIVKDAMVHNFCDGSYEDFRMHHGCPHSLATETPGKLRISKRIGANIAIIDTFIELTLKEFYDD